MGKLEGKIAVITGTTEGITLESAKQFVQEGVDVFISGRSQAKLDEAVSLIGCNVQAAPCDSVSLSDLKSPVQRRQKTEGLLRRRFRQRGPWRLCATEAVTAEASTQFSASTPVAPASPPKKRCAAERELLRHPEQLRCEFDGPAAYVRLQYIEGDSLSLTSLNTTALPVPHPASQILRSYR